MSEDPSSLNIALSFDVGGTFTDFVAIDTATGAIVARHKVLTNARYLEAGVCPRLAGNGRRRTRRHRTGFAVHSTTLVTNR
ncbi:MAG: hypothetical protein M9890_06015 [Thermomicrobiales bacterium]|nr:hypothetical protein [Thermomicrobiales bacterium]